VAFNPNFCIVNVRFCGAGYQSELPVWLRSSVKNYASFGLALKEMAGFFRTAEKMVSRANLFPVEISQHYLFG
jgi:hypothetical protein